MNSWGPQNGERPEADRGSAEEDVEGELVMDGGLVC
jgi:hypothetical protein